MIGTLPRMNISLIIILLMIYLERYGNTWDNCLLCSFSSSHFSNFSRSLIPCVLALLFQAKCKAALQKELGLPIRPDVPLVRYQCFTHHFFFSKKYSGFIYQLDLQIGFIGRLDYQKGIDLIKLIMPNLMREDIQFVSTDFFL